MSIAEIPAEHLLREMYADIKVVMQKQIELTEHQRVANGRTAKLEGRTDAAMHELAMLSAERTFNRWLLALMLTILTIGVGIAGLVLGFVM